jgi:hypothetical protein
MSNIQPYQSQLPANHVDFVEQFTPVKCLIVFKNTNTPALCIDSGTPSLAMVRKQYSEDFITAYIALWIDNLNDFVNAARRMTPAQIEETAIILFQEYYYLNIADINLVFRRIKKGEFGQLFAEIDGIKILSWFEQYAQERMRTSADQEMVNHSRYVDNHTRSSNPEAEKIMNIRAKGFFEIEKSKR